MALSAKDRIRVTLRNEDGEPRLTPKLIASVFEQLQAPGRWVTLEGRDGVFCEGFDMRLLPAQIDRPEEITGLKQFVALLEAIERTPRPVISLVDGAVQGGGVALAAASDLVLATPTSTFGLPEVLWGLLPAMALPFVARRTGLARARLLGLGIPSIDAAEALRWGLVDRIVPNVEEAAAVHLRRFAKMDATAMGEVKALAAALTSNPAYVTLANQKFLDSLVRPTTRVRLAKLAEGEVPYEEDA